MWWKDTALVVAGSNNLKRGVISSFHDPPYRGHPGIANTYHLRKQDYWWPTVRQDTEEYVKGCAICQADKINTHHQESHLFPITTDPEAQPFEVVTMDFITKLPPSNGYNSILTVTDHDCTKAASVLVALTNFQLKLKPQLMAIPAQPSHMWPKPAF